MSMETIKCTYMGPLVFLKVNAHNGRYDGLKNCIYLFSSPCLDFEILEIFFRLVGGHVTTYVLHITQYKSCHMLQQNG